MRGVKASPRKARCKLLLQFSEVIPALELISTTRFFEPILKQYSKQKQWLLNEYSVLFSCIDTIHVCQVLSSGPSSLSNTFSSGNQPLKDIRQITY